jgi:hypothetical protein
VEWWGIFHRHELSSGQPRRRFDPAMQRHASHSPASRRCFEATAANSRSSTRAPLRTGNAGSGCPSRDSRQNPNTILSSRMTRLPVQKQSEHALQATERLLRWCWRRYPSGCGFWMRTDALCMATPPVWPSGRAHVTSAQAFPDPHACERGTAAIDRNARVQAQLLNDALDISRIVRTLTPIGPRSRHTRRKGAGHDAPGSDREGNRHCGT